MRYFGGRGAPDLVFPVVICSPRNDIGMEMKTKSNKSRGKSETRVMWAMAVPLINREQHGDENADAVVVPQRARIQLARAAEHQCRAIPGSTSA